jgi:hypothetical protein
LSLLIKAKKIVCRAGSCNLENIRLVSEERSRKKWSIRGLGKDLFGRGKVLFDMN